VYFVAVQVSFESGQVCVDEHGAMMKCSVPGKFVSGT
jgi:hypothetical protein